MQLHDTIAAIATPAGRGGIGVVRLSGTDALAIAARVLPLGTSLADRHATLAMLPDEELAPHAADFARDTERRTR